MSLTWDEIRLDPAAAEHPLSNTQMQKLAYEARRERRMEGLNELAAALAKAQAEIEPAPKDADNPYFKSKYASLPAVRDAMREAFAKNGLSVVQMPITSDEFVTEDVIEYDQRGTQVTTKKTFGTVKVTTLLLHESGQSLDCGTLSAKVDVSNPQKAGSAITYFRRYALAAISQTVADEDDDGNAASQNQAPKKPAAKLTKKDQEWVTDTLKGIQEAESLEALAGVGEIIKDKPKKLQDVLRGQYAEKQRELKEIQQ